MTEYQQQFISVIIPTYNPEISALRSTLTALRAQSFPLTRWEMIIIDNNSCNNFQEQLELDWHPSATILREHQQGLTYARLKGLNAAAGKLIILVDDDNLLHHHFLAHAWETMNQHPNMGAIGGKILPIFQDSPPVWLQEFYGNLALRDFGDEPIYSSWEQKYPHCAPVGAGMVIRKKALHSYIHKITHIHSPVTDRTGNSLSSGGDNDIILEILKAGYSVGYFPALKLSHLIPAERTTRRYISRLIYDTNKSWVQLLNAHGLCPWKSIATWTLPLRKSRSYLSLCAWKGPKHYLRWRAACGIFEGQSKI